MKYALVILVCLCATPAFAQPKLFQDQQPVTSSSCDPITVFKGMTPQNFQSRIKQCADDDLKQALADANTSPLDYTALGCLSAVKTMRDAIVAGGAITAFQGFRRAKRSGLISNCLNYVTSTVSLP